MSPNPEIVAKFVEYKQRTAIETSGRQPQLDIIQITDKEYSPLSSPQLPSELESSKQKQF